MQLEDVHDGVFAAGQFHLETSVTDPRLLTIRLGRFGVHFGQPSKLWLPSLDTFRTFVA